MRSDAEVSDDAKTLTMRDPLIPNTVTDNEDDEDGDDEPNGSNKPKEGVDTGDHTPLALFIVLLLASFLVIIIFFIKSGKKDKEEEKDVENEKDEE